MIRLVPARRSRCVMRCAGTPRVTRACTNSGNDRKEQWRPGCQGLRLEHGRHHPTLCQSINGNTVNALSAYCPAEAKAYREAARRKACERRSYTAKANLDKCLSGGATM